MASVMLLQEEEDEASPHEWALKSITTSILKCTRWQIEEPRDLLNCPYHYFCDSTYPGDYPSIVDLLALLFAAFCLLSTAAFTLMAFTKFTAAVKRKYLLPSGPIALPFVLLILAKGHRINTFFPLSHMGPALLQLLQLSALAFRHEVDKDLRYAVLKASTVSGILHASLYLDAIILPYYTGLEVLRESTFSGECTSCVCRTEALVVGGKSVSYRGLSKTSLSVIFALCSRMVCRIYGEERLSLVIKWALEGISWIFIAIDSVYLVSMNPEGGLLATKVVYRMLCALVFLNIFIKVRCFLAWASTRQIQFNSNHCHNVV
ncbi:uncharacterized protein [Typha angustifolia]|uniref:uncharacterized protein n=1 Tax=Typha angustifolia TaxID=59011 RepID=UPI003C2FC823